MKSKFAVFTVASILVIAGQVNGQSDGESETPTQTPTVTPESGSYSVDGTQGNGNCFQVTPILWNGCEPPVHGKCRWKTGLTEQEKDASGPVWVEYIGSDGKEYRKPKLRDYCHELETGITDEHEPPASICLVGYDSGAAKIGATESFFCYRKSKCDLDVTLTNQQAVSNFNHQVKVNGVWVGTDFEEPVMHSRCKGDDNHPLDETVPTEPLTVARSCSVERCKPVVDATSPSTESPPNSPASPSSVTGDAP